MCCKRVRQPSQSELVQVALGYIRRPNGDWICQGIATPGDIAFHFLYFADYYRGDCNAETGVR